MRVITGLMSLLLISYPSFLTFSALENKAQDRTIFIQARQYEFTPSRIEARLGDTLTIILQSNDSRHGFFIDELDIDQQINVQAPVSVKVVLNQTGTFTFLCNVPCGSYHPYMNGKLYVDPNIQYIAFATVLSIVTIALIWRVEQGWESRGMMKMLEIVEES